MQGYYLLHNVIMMSLRCMLPLHCCNASQLPTGCECFRSSTELANTIKSNCIASD